MYVVPSSWQLYCAQLTNQFRTVSPDEYKQAIYAHSQRFAVFSSFPGRNYSALANWLIRPTPSSSLLPKPGDSHILIVVHNLDEYGLDRVQTITDTDPISLPPPRSHPGQRKGRLLFVRGFPSPSWVAELGSRYRVDPEFFYRHLDFLDASPHGSCFNTPSLLNTTNNIIHIPVNTILTDAMAYSTANLHDNSVGYRNLIRDQLSKYKKGIQKLASCGDSIVREYSILSNRYSVIEQRISVCVMEDGDEGWIGTPSFQIPRPWRNIDADKDTALLCMDNGRDLERPPTGPWTHALDGKTGLKVTSLPVVQHHPKMAWRKLGDVRASWRPPPNPLAQPTTGIPQSISTLPLEYQSLLSALDLAKRAKLDPLHALVPVFAQSAFSEVAFLNLVHKLLDKMTEPQPLGSFLDETFESLQHFEIILERHADQIRHCIRAIQVLSERSEFSPSLNTGLLSPGGRHSRSPLRSPSTTDPKDPITILGLQQQTTSFSVTGVLQDHEDLLERCLRLMARVHSAKNTEMNRAMILESRRAIEQSERMKKLTTLATYFIPLTFTASIFGMNFQPLGQGELPVWWYLVIAVPITMLTHLLYSWDLQAILARSVAKLKVLRSRPADI